MCFIKRLFVSLAFICFSAVISAKTYPDPQYRKATSESVGAFTKPMEVRLEVMFQRNGVDTPKVIKYISKPLEESLLKSGAFVVASNEAAPVLRFTLNNIADLDAARKKGFVTGLTFGGKGSTITDYYEAHFALQLTDATVEKDYKHALVTTLGRAEVPFVGVEPVKIKLAINVVLEDIVMNFVQDLKTDGKLEQSTVVVNAGM